MPRLRAQGIHGQDILTGLKCLVLTAFKRVRLRFLHCLIRFASSSELKREWSLACTWPHCWRARAHPASRIRDPRLPPLPPTFFSIFGT